MIKTSLNKKLMIVFSSILIVVVMLNLVINSQLLPKVYKHQKIDAMEDLHNNIRNQYLNNSDTDKIIEIVKDVLSYENLRVFIWDTNDRLIVDSLPLSNEDQFFFKTGQQNEPSKNPDEEFSTDIFHDGKEIHHKRNHFMRDFFYGRNELYIFYSKPTDDAILRNTDEFLVFFHNSFDDLNDENFYLRSELSNGYKLLIQMPYASIDSAVQLSNSLLFFTGIIMLFIGVIVVAVTSGNIAKPIKELSNIAKSMENLDFSRKYQHNRRDEIGQLGDSVNSLSEKLESTINELYEKNNKLQEDIELKSRIDNMRKEFIANASHELKTPVTLIGGYAEGLRDNIADNEETRKIYTDYIIEETARIDSIIRQMLDLMEIDSKDSLGDTIEFSLSDLTEESINSFELLIKSKEITLDYETHGDCRIVGEYRRISQAVSNYISNAINHAKNEKRIKITVSEEADAVKLSVYNTGNSIPQEDLASIWERFYKVDKAHTREYGGTGLGLAIVKSVIELHNGEYGVENLNDGVEFYFKINKEISNEF